MSLDLVYYSENFEWDIGEIKSILNFVDFKSLSETPFNYKNYISVNNIKDISKEFWNHSFYNFITGGLLSYYNYLYILYSKFNPFMEKIILNKYKNTAKYVRKEVYNEYYKIYFSSGYDVDLVIKDKNKGTIKL